MKSLKQITLEHLAQTEDRYENETELLLSIIGSVHFDNDAPNLSNKRSIFKMTADHKLKHKEIEASANIEKKYKRGKLVKITNYYPDLIRGKRQKRLEKWYDENEDEHRDNGPAEKSWNHNGQLEHQLWYKHGIGHRENGPAYEAWFDNGQLTSQVWYKDGEIHNEDGPAIRWWHENGEKMGKQWLVNGIWHRIGKPAVKSWHTNGKPKEEKWYLNGTLHNTEGPAFQKWSMSGNLKKQEWWENGIRRRIRSNSIGPR